MTRPVLPEFPNLKQQKHLAKDLHRACKAGEATALRRLRDAHPRLAGASDEQILAHPCKLTDAQLVLAREYGFPSWPALRLYIAQISSREKNRKVMSLIRAAATKNHREVRGLLRKDPNLARTDIAGDNEHRALHFAVRNRDAEMVRILIDSGADPRQGVYPRRDATSPWALAEDRGYAEIVALFEEAEEKQRKEARCPNLAVTPAIEALGQLVQSGRDDEVMQRIGMDPDLLESCDRQGETVVHHAARWGRGRLLPRLLEAGAHVNKMNVKGLRALDLAVRFPGKREVADACRSVARDLLDQADIIVALETAVALGDLARIRQYAEREPERLAPGTDRQCDLLQIAVRHDRLDALALLLELGCDPDDRHRLNSLEEEVYDQGAPLWMAAGEAKYALAEVLLQYGADPNAVHYASGDPLSRAYNNRDRKMIDMLFSQGATLDIITAVLEGDAEQALPRLENGEVIMDKKTILLEQEPEKVHDIIGHAICGGNPAIVKWCLDFLQLPSHHPSWPGLFYQCMRFWRIGPNRKHCDFDRENYFVILKMLLDAGGDPSDSGRWNFAPLHETIFIAHVWGKTRSAPEERVRFATMLLDAGAKLDMRDDEILSTPLGWAARWGRLELAQLFLERGARTHLTDDEPWATPLAWAEKYDHKEMASLLRKHGAKR